MDGSDCRGYRTTRRNLPSSIAYRPPFTAISRNIGVIDMQTSHTTASAAATTSLARRIVAASWKPVLFAVLMWLSAAAARTAGRYLLAALVGGVVVVYAFGFVIQSALTGAPLAAVALASMGFVVGDAIKAVVASLAAAGLSKLGR